MDKAQLEQRLRHNRLQQNRLKQRLLRLSAESDPKLRNTLGRLYLSNLAEPAFRDLALALLPKLKAPQFAALTAALDAAKEQGEVSSQADGPVED